MLQRHSFHEPMLGWGFQWYRSPRVTHAPISKTSKLTGFGKWSPMESFLFTLASPFYAFWDSRDGVTHIPGGNSLLSTFSPTQPEIHFHGDSKLFQVDNGD